MAEEAQTPTTESGALTLAEAFKAFLEAFQQTSAKGDPRQQMIEMLKALLQTLEGPQTNAQAAPATAAEPAPATISQPEISQPISVAQPLPIEQPAVQQVSKPEAPQMDALTQMLQMRAMLDAQIAKMEAMEKERQRELRVQKIADVTKNTLERASDLKNRGVAKVKGWGKSISNSFGA